MEEWRDIPGWEGYYQASTLGRIRSIDRTVMSKGCYVSNGKILAESVSKKGYSRTILYKNNKPHYYLTHKLIAATFPEICGKWFEGAEVDHINTIRTDNRPENLKFVSHKENCNNQITKNKNSTSKGKWLIKLSANNEILHFYASTGIAEKETGVPRQRIYQCCVGKTKTAGGYHWRYV